MSDTTRDQLFGDDETDLETVEAGQEFREVLNEFIEDGSEAVEGRFQERAGALTDAIYAEDDELAADIRDIDLYSMRASGEETEQLTDFLETGVEAAANRGWLITILEGYEVRGTDLNVNHDIVSDLMDQFIETEEEIPEKRDGGRDAINQIDSDINDPKSPFVEASDRTRSLSRDQTQSQQRSAENSEAVLRVVDQPDELVPVGAVVILPLSIRTRRARDEPTEGTLSVSLSEPLYGGFVDFDPLADQPVDDGVEGNIRSVIGQETSPDPVGVAATDGERTVSLDREQEFVGLAVYVDDTGVEELEIELESTADDINSVHETVLLQVQTEAFIEARADALDQSLPWFLVGGGGVAAAGAVAGGYVLYNRMSGGGDDTPTDTTE